LSTTIAPSTTSCKAFDRFLVRLRETGSQSAAFSFLERVLPAAATQIDAL
jgi:hypothetical protein